MAAENTLEGHALVTGGGRGIGRLVAQALAAEGMAVGLIARSGEELCQSVALVEAAGGIAAAEVADVTDERSLGTAVERLRERLGPVEVLINNAGIVGPIGPAWEVDADQWWRTMDVNVRGTLLAMQLVLPEMVLRRSGRIVNLSSQAGVFRWPLVSAYSVSKAAVVKLSENMAPRDAAAQRRGLQRPSGAAADRHGRAGVRRPRIARLERGPRVRVGAPRDRRGTRRRPGPAIELIVRLASGHYDELSGRSSRCTTTSTRCSPSAAARSAVHQLGEALGRLDALFDHRVDHVLDRADLRRLPDDLAGGIEVHLLRLFGVAVAA